MKTHVPTVLGAMCAMLVLGSAPAYAQDRTDIIDGSEQVSYSDLDLNSEAGATTFLSRVQNAAENVCGYDRRDRWTSRTASRACVRDAMSKAVERVNTAAVSTQYASNSGSSRGRTIFASSRNRSPASANVQVAAADLETATARVSYADLDLSTDGGRNTLQRRLSRATREVCGASGSTATRFSAEHRDCLNTARDSAQTQYAAITGGTQYAARPQAETTATAAVAPTEAATPQLLADASRSPDGFGICAARTLDANFAGRSSVLGSAERLEVGYAVDAASVCAIDRITIAANRNDALAQRRANALRAAIIARGVPARQVVVEHTDDTSASGARVHMNFSGVAHTASPSEVLPAGA